MNWALARRGWVWMTVAVVLVGCHAGVGSGRAVPPLVAGDFTIVERGEAGPITALAIRAPYLWGAGADEMGGHALRAIAVDDQGAAWVASATEVGRWITTATGTLRYEGTGSP